MTRGRTKLEARDRKEALALDERRAWRKDLRDALLEAARQRCGTGTP